jgi:hypothetical protein
VWKKSVASLLPLSSSLCASRVCGSGNMGLCKRFPTVQILLVYPVIFRVFLSMHRTTIVGAMLSGS